MNDVREWLDRMGLVQFADTFASQKIDFDLLTELCDADLKAIGVSALGDRMRIRKAIASLASAPVLQAESTAAVVALEPARAGESERRQLTVMFCDLVGSTALSRRLDPEDMQALIRRYHATTAGAVVPYGGHVAQFLGDGVLVYFGYPQAHEDDAARAVRAALEVVAAVAGLSPEGHSQLRTRIGIATGVVVVGQIGAGTPAAEMSATGDAPNLAARLQGLAQPGQVVIASETRRLVGAAFELELLGPLPLKGIAQPVEAWRVLSERSAASRFEAQQSRELVRFIGRDSELLLLLERWAMARDGDGQLVLMSGEAGIGKSRISQTLRERLAAESHDTVLWQCSPYYGSSALYPVIHWLERLAGLAVADVMEVRADKLEQAVVHAGAALEPPAIGHLVRLLGLPEGGRVPPDLSPQQMKVRTLHALTELLNAMSSARPLLFLIEDAHWIDPTTEELLGLVIDRLRAAPVLVLVTGRPEYSPAWGSKANMTQLPLSRLGQRQSAALVDAVTGGKVLPPEVLAEILRKSDGTPLFVEELTKAVIGSGLLKQSPTDYKLQGSLSALAIPSTLQDSLMARLDRLSGAKEVAQVGAAIGREFSHALLAAVMAMPQAALDEAIGELIGAELVFRRGLSPNTTYLFKHALVRDAAYQSMVRTQRALRHGQIAEAIRQFESETVVLRPELLAHHCQEAGQDEQAIGLWAQAGELAVSRSSGAEAVAHFDAALELLAKSPDTLDRATLELSLRRRRGQSLILSVGPNSPAFDANAARALELARHLDRSEEFVDNWVDFASARFSAGRIVEVIERIGELGRQRAAALPLRSRVKIAVVLGTAHTMLGELDDAWRLLSEGMSLDDESPATHARPLVVVDPGVYVRSYAARVRALQGHLEESADLAFQAGQIAATRGHLPTRLMSMGAVISSLILQGRHSDALSQAEEFHASARLFGVQNRIAASTILLGQVKVVLGAADEGHLLLRHGYDLWLSAAGKQMCTAFAADAADVLLRSGHADAAARFIDDGLAVQAATEECFYAAELERIQGLLRDHAGDPAVAAQHLRRSLVIADRQGARLFALRTATDLSQLLRRQGRTEEGLSLLQPLYSGFTSGLDWPDLMRAKAELDRFTA